MKKETYSFVDYLFHNEDNCPMLGICFYDEKILFGWEEDFGVRSYRFRVQLVSDQKSKHFDRLMRKPYEYELLDFVYTCDLKDFTYKVPANPRFDLDEQTNFDWEKLVSVAIPKRLEEAKNRLKRKYKRFIPKPVIYEKGGTGYCHNNEFLWFTDESAYSWAGPFSLDEKKGCIMIAGINKHHAANSYPVLDVSKDHSFYDLPVSAKNRLFKHATGSNIHYVLAPEEKADLFRNLTDEEQYHTATDYNGIHNTKGIKKINVPGDGIGASDGIYNVIQETTNDSSWTNSPYPQPTFGPERIFATEMSITTSVAGLWTAYCQMVSSLNSVTPGNMPWNLQRTKYGSSGNATVNPSLLGDLADNISNVGKVSNSYDQSLPVELQAEPPGWIANRYFTAGFTIMDGNGNLQICGRSGISGATSPSWGTSDGSYTVEPYGADPRYNLGWKCVQALTSTGSWSAGASISAGQTIKDSNGNTQFSASGGITGATVPTWPTRVGSITTDGTVQWQTRCPFTPAIHRPQSIPVYPFYWQGNNTFPTTWVAATAYALNATVIDANGNTQQCTTAGTSAATAPVWSQTLASVTSDGATLKWTLITLAAETNAFQKPPTATSGLTRWGANNQWQRNNWHGSTNYDLGWQADNLAFGWWIYSVSINRMILNPANQVSVTIGCIRNGSFVAFGTWDTGQTIQVLWPIFTSDALVYQCGERVDIQAVAIASGGARVSTGATASGYPICAAFVSDTTALLNLL